MKIQILFVVIVSSLLIVESYKILGIFNSFSKSHYVLGARVMKELALNGHDVTVYTTFLSNATNFKEIPITNVVENFEALEIDYLNLPDVSIWNKMYMFYKTAKLMVNDTFNCPNVKNLLASNDEYDLIVLESFMNEALIGFRYRFNAPVIALGTFSSNNWINNFVGNVAPFSVVPHPFLPFTDHMTFNQRAYNLLLNMYDLLLQNFIRYPEQKELYDQAFSDPKPDFYHEIKHGVSLAFVNDHYSISYPKSYVSNMIEIGGAQIERNTKSLPNDIQKYLDSAIDGAIFFSLGSNVKAKLLPAEKRDAILKTFAKFPKIKFLWKWEDSELPGKPANLLIQKWFPQNEILAHKNIRCFITHGGLLSTTEAIYHGIPLIGIPIFADQDLNMAQAASAGYGLKISYKNLSEESLTWAVTQHVNRIDFKEKAKKMSDRYRDQPMEPLKLMTWWVEYVGRHKGAYFMKSAAQDLNFYQYHMIDVIVYFLLVLGLIYYALKKIIKAFVYSEDTTKEKLKKK